MNKHDMSQMNCSDYGIKDILSAWLQEEVCEINAATEKADFLDGCFDILGLICATLITIPKPELAQALRNYQDAQELRARPVNVPHHHAILALVRHLMDCTFADQSVATDFLIGMFKSKALRSFPYLNTNDLITHYQGQERDSYFATSEEFTDTPQQENNNVQQAKS